MKRKVTTQDQTNTQTKRQAITFSTYEHSEHSESTEQNRGTKPKGQVQKKDLLQIDKEPTQPWNSARTSHSESEEVEG